jgi:hypothetical protein
VRCPAGELFLASRIVDDQGRLRENMKALRGSAEEKGLLQQLHPPTR